MTEANNTNSSDWNSVNEDYRKALENSATVEEMLKVLQEDENLLLPIDLRVETHEKLLSIERKSEYLRMFASYLRIFEPSWRDRADKLDAEADILDGIQ